MDQATIVEHGERVRVWFVPLHNGWVKAVEHPAAVCEEASSERRDPRCPPGTVWRREVELLLPLRTPVLSRVTSPLVERMNPIQYLTRERRAVRRHVEETWFVVSGNYRLSRTNEPSSFSRAGTTPRASQEPPSTTPDKNRR